MDNNVLISIKTYQEYDGEKDEPIELLTEGRFGKINDKYYIVYKESEMTGFPDTTTTLKVWQDNVVVSRKGRFNMKLDYVKGKRKLCLYPTPYGEIGAQINTLDVDFEFSENSGRMRVDYTIDADNENVCKNSLNIKIEPLDTKG